MRISEKIDDKFNYLWQEGKHEEDERTEFIDNFLEGHRVKTNPINLKARLPEIEEKMRQAETQREEGDKEVLDTLKERLSSLSNLINDEKKTREDSEHNHYEMIKEFVDGVREEITSEKKAREESEESILNALEETCVKLSELSKI